MSSTLKSYGIMRVASITLDEVYLKLSEFYKLPTGNSCMASGILSFAFRDDARVVT